MFNKVLNITFTFDIVLNFFVAYESSKEEALEDTNKWEQSHWKICCRYVAWPLSDGGRAGWFWIDLIATGPSYLTMLFPHRGKHHNMKALMLLRVLRIIRMLRLGRTYQSFVLRCVRMGYSLNLMEVVKFLVITTLACHVMALAWVSIESQVWKGIMFELLDLDSPTGKSWLSDMLESKSDPCYPSAQENGVCVYTLALYWAIMTITAVGYGDISPQCKPEYFLCALSILILGFTWAYVVGSIVALITNSDHYGALFNQQMDDLNEMCDSRNVPVPLRRKLRDYMTMSAHIPRLHGHRKMLETRLSKRLKDTVQQLNRGELLRSVFWADSLQQSAKLEIIGRLDPHFFGPGEEIGMEGTMILVRQGRAVMNFKILERGSVAGEVNILLKTASLVRDTFKTLTYVHALTLGKKELREVCSMYPSADTRLRRAQVRCAVWRAFCRAARRRNGLEAQVENILRKGESFAKSVPLDRNGMMMQQVQDSVKAAKKAMEDVRASLQYNELQLRSLQDELESSLASATNGQSPAAPDKHADGDAKGGKSRSMLM